MIGYSKEELLNMTPLDLNAPESHGKLVPLWEEFLEKKHIIAEIQHVRKDGKKLDVEVSSHLFEYNEKQTVLAIVRNITERKQAELEKRNSDAFQLSLLEASPDFIIVLDADGKILSLNRLHPSHKEEDVIGQKASAFMLPQYRDNFNKVFRQAIHTKQPQTTETVINFPDGEKYFLVRLKPLQFSGDEDLVMLVATDISERMKIEQRLNVTLEDLQKRNMEIEMLLTGARAILENRELKPAAKIIFDACKKMIGASSGYVAFLSEDKTENKVLLLDPGGMKCTVDPLLRMPIRGFREIAYKSNTAIYDNNYADSEWMKYLPEGHVLLKNVMFVPLIVEKKPIGLLGLGNKPGGFTEYDKKLASAFGELAAIALMNSRTIESLEKSETYFRSVVETATDAVVIADSNGIIVDWNRCAESIFNYNKKEIIGKSIKTIIPKQFRKKHENGFENYLKTEKPNIIGKTIEVVGIRKDEMEFPVEISLASWKAKGELFFTAIIRDISERKKAERELLKAKEDADKANLAKSEFLANMSHELRTPLNAVLGFGQLLEAEFGDPSQKDFMDYLKYIKENGNHLLEMVNDILDLSKIEAGKDELKKEPFDLKQILTRIPKTICTLAAKKSIQVKIDIESNIGWLDGDEKKIKQVIFNLLSNAVKFTGKEKNIGIIAHGEDEKVIISVWDEGIGIPKDDLEKIFDPFEQVRGHKGKTMGTGLGLSISKQLIGFHNGSISIKSEVGKGSTFTVRIPGRIKNKQNQKPVKEQAMSAANIEGNIEILVIEDNETNTALIKKTLELEGYIVDCVESGEDAVEQVKKKEYNLLLVDIQLLGMDGVETLHRIKKIYPGDFKAIALTAFAMRGDKEKYLADGFDGYISKPVDLHLLRDTARDVLDMKMKKSLQTEPKKK
jgi:PAS domain S-box-containing protein